MPELRGGYIQFSAMLPMLLALTLFASRGSANLRAPYELPKPASFALMREGSSDDPLVIGEDLRFYCQPNACRVTATYRIHVQAARRISTALILPAQKSVTVRHVDTVFTVAAVLAPEIPWPEHPYWGELPPALYRAAFDVELVPGENQLMVEYVQPLGVQERGHSYFRDGTRVKLLTYELWPLGEWKRKSGMQIRIVVDVPRRPPSRWKRWFDSYEDTTCRLVPEKGGTVSSPILSHATRQVGGRYQRQLVVSAEPIVSEKLLCEWGRVDAIYSDGTR